MNWLGSNQFLCGEWPAITSCAVRLSALMMVREVNGIMGHNCGIYLLHSHDVTLTRNARVAIVPAEVHAFVLLLGSCSGWST